MIIHETTTSSDARDAAYDRRTELVREMVEKESAAQDAKTARLRALRLAKEAEDRTAEVVSFVVLKCRKSSR